jgi:hypothetical protein
MFAGNGIPRIKPLSARNAGGVFNERRFAAAERAIQ